MQALKDLSRALEKFGVAGLKPRADGRFSLGYDGGRRLDIHSLPDGRLILEMHLAYLPEQGAARTTLLESALRFSTTRMPREHDVLCLSADGNSLLLQCEVPARAGVATVERTLERFLNAADAWWLAVGLGSESAPSRLVAQSRSVVVQP